ncbi:MAG TPA: hypothetical protein VEC57_01060 [Candidatus Limnocylindrales bacterium]|nr:hypothetical protein [Candidatus Limnocylindrales bacterium]
MARIALVEAGAGTATAVEAVAAGHELVACSLSAVPDGVDLAIVDYNSTGPVDRGALAGLEGRVPVLLLVDRRMYVAEGLYDAAAVAVLRKPFDLFELRLKMRGLLISAIESAEPSPIPPPPGPRRSTDSVPTLDWLTPPLLPAAAAATMAAARRMATSLWIVGEMGSGREQVAIAFARRHQPALELVTWFAGQSLEEALAGCRAASAALFVPDVETRALSEQKRLETYLARNPDRCVIATSADDPAEAVVGGAMSRRLYHLLARVCVRLPALRERRADIAPLAAAMASATAGKAFAGMRVRLAPSAVERLELYPWPGNVSELEGVIARSVLARAATAGEGVCMIEAGDLVFSPALSPAELPASVPVPRAGVVVALPTAARKQEDASETVAASQGNAAAAAATAIEPVLAGLAHDLRNPMATLKTFASLAAAGAVAGGGEDAELARLAAQACTRIDDHLDLLQRYSDLPDGNPAAVDLIAVMSEAIQSAGIDVEVGARRALWARVDPHHARFMAEAMLEEARARIAAGEQAWLDTTPGAALELRVPLGTAAVEKLGKWVRGQALPWRLALAREVARRSGGDVDVSASGEELRVVWKAVEAEEQRHGDQAGSADRRRRSRSS